MEEKNSNRYWVLFILLLGWVIASMDRAVMSIAVIPITSDFNLTASSTGIILSSFFLGYALSQIPGGYLADRFGSRRVLLVAVITWSVFTGLTGLAWSLASLLVCRFLFGIFEGSFPAASSLSIAENFPLKQRARAKTIMLLGSGIGMIGAPIIGAAMLEAIGWRMMFGILALCGISMFILFWFVIKDKTKDPGSNQTTKKVPLKTVIKNPLVWSLFITYVGIYVVNWGLMSWMPTYLVKARGLSLMEMGAATAVVGLVLLVSAPLVGVLLDKITGKERYLASGGAIGAAVFLYFMVKAPSPTMVVVFQALALVSCSFVSLTTATQPMKRFPLEVVGTVSGLVNTGGQIGSFISPLVMGLIIDASGGSYAPAFAFLGVCVLVAAVAGATIPVIKTPDDPKVDAPGASS
ncbi:MFS transporter [Desulfitobacterium sp. THU1]|uniref:MFS transporter n=1 Tax=Desulfitobacterium sp. THU1 TaxID=3138072 RepID=UPI00311E082C